MIKYTHILGIIDSIEYINKANINKVPTTENVHKDNMPVTESLPILVFLYRRLAKFGICGIL